MVTAKKLPLDELSGAIARIMGLLLSAKKSTTPSNTSPSP